jgi:hypothetical protein
LHQSRNPRFLGVISLSAAADTHAINPDSATNDRWATDDDCPAGPGATRAIDSTGTHDRIRIRGFDNHRSGKSYKSSRNKQY